MVTKLESELRLKENIIHEMEIQKDCQEGLVENLLLNLKSLSNAVSNKIGINFETPPID